VEAAEMLADPQFLPSLRELHERLGSLPKHDLQYLQGWLTDAIAACEARRDGVTSSPSASQPLPRRP
jgi:hypothetical protein